ncbi:MAG: ParB N-terminal domain-containing protein, partial [bacterium]
MRLLCGLCGYLLKRKDIIIQQISIASIKVGFRTRFDVGNIAELAEDIKLHGLLHPIIVSSENELIAGYRRLKAAESLGWEEVPATIQVPSTKDQVPNLGNASQSEASAAISALTCFDMQLSENLQRKDLNPIELSD